MLQEQSPPSKKKSLTKFTTLFKELSLYTIFPEKDAETDT